jgi:hypothetical protein
MLVRVGQKANLVAISIPFCCSANNFGASAMARIQYALQKEGDPNLPSDISANYLVRRIGLWGVFILLANLAQAGSATLGPRPGLG